jgi:hypothetical protein
LLEIAELGIQKYFTEKCHMATMTCLTANRVSVYAYAFELYVLSSEWHSNRELILTTWQHFFGDMYQWNNWPEYSSIGVCICLTLKHTYKLSFDFILMDQNFKHATCWNGSPAFTVELHVSNIDTQTYSKQQEKKISVRRYDMWQETF